MPDRLKIRIVVNPISGTHSKDDFPVVAQQELDDHRIDYEVKFTEAPRHATALAREAVAAGYHAVIAVGGDGTVNEVASVLHDTDVALGIVPCGSGNGLARHLHIPLSIPKALQLINDNIIEAVDYCTVNERPFFCTCGVGFDAQVSQKFANEDTRGLVTYIKTTIEEFFRYRPVDYTIQIDGQKLHERAFVIACCNAAQYGNNALVAPRASMKDGKIDITIIHSFNLGEAALLGARLFTSTIDRDRNVSIYRGKQIIIDRELPDVMHLDGEPVMMPEHLVIQCHPSALRVLVPSMGKAI